MHSFRLFSAACLFLCLVTASMLPPLHALLLLRDRGSALAPGGKSQTVRQPGVKRTAPAGSRWKTRWEAGGSVRRIYLPDAAGLVGSWSERAFQLLGQVPWVQSVTALDLQVVSERRTPSGTHVRLQQFASGVPLWGAEAVVSFDTTSRPLLLALDLQDPPQGHPQKMAMVDRAQAIQTALAAVRFQSALLAPPDAQLYWRLSGRAWGLAWRVKVACAQPAGDWQVWVDASNGRMLSLQDQTLFTKEPQRNQPQATAAAQVFLPDPVTASGNELLTDLNDMDSAVPASAYSPVTLRGLDAAKAGILALRGEYVRLVDWEDPQSPPVTSVEARFVYERSQQGFEDVMVYYHIDAMQRWYQSLGFDDANNRSQPADAHGFWGEDNSKYIPSMGWLSFGEGGVDDAEDAAVIVHEYGHATQYNIVPSWGIGGHEAAMGEGFGDYLANSYAYSQHPQRVIDWNGIFQWDGHNEFWSGRPAIDTNLRYPDDADGSPHWSGTLWCSALTDALYLLGDRSVMDQLVVNHHYLLTGQATMEDAANAILLSDLAINAGAHVPQLTEVFARWGMLADAEPAPLMVLHTPADITDAQQPLPDIEARLVVIDEAHQPQSVFLHTLDASGNAARWPMQFAGGDLWRGKLPGAAGTDVHWRYWIESIDAQGRSIAFPAAAATAPYEFLMGFVAENFESAAGWQASVGTDQATRGTWVRAEPMGTSWQPSRDHSGTGTQCWVTGNASAGAPASEADIDGGGTTLQSPLWDVEGAATLQLRYWRWFATNTAPDVLEDTWRVRASGDAGATWVVLEETHVGSSRWELREFDLLALLPGATTLQLQFFAEDGAVASLVEAALDDLLLRMSHSTDVAVSPPRPVALAVHPNPFNPNTTISYELQRAGPVRLDLYDLRGRRVRRLVDTAQSAGIQRIAWDGRDDRGRPLASGVYLLRLETAQGSSSRKVTLLR